MTRPELYRTGPVTVFSERKLACHDARWVQSEHRWVQSEHRWVQSEQCDQPS